MASIAKYRRQTSADGLVWLMADWSRSPHEAIDFNQSEQTKNRKHVQYKNNNTCAASEQDDSNSHENIYVIEQYFLLKICLKKA
jgi:hypothetical protein